MMLLPDASLGCFFTLIFEIDSRFLFMIASGRLSGLTMVMCLAPRNEVNQMLLEDCCD